MPKTKHAMPPASRGLELPLPLALSIVLGVVAITIYAVRQHARRQRRRARRHDRFLAHTLRSFLDGRVRGADLLREVEATDEGSYWTVLESLSLRLERSEWLRLSQALAATRHAAAERKALADDSPWRRALAARRLALLRSRTSWRELRRAMRRGPEMVTLAAAMALARYRDAGALRWIFTHSDALARRHRSALVALLRGFGPKGMPIMTDALGRGIENPRLALATVDALGLGGCREARPVLERLLEQGGLDMRAASARALGLLRAVECGTSLIGALKDDAWQVRAQAARALGRVGAPIATHALAARLTDASWWVRHHAAYALLELGEDGQAALRHVVASSADPYARDMAREALDGGIHRLTA